MISRLLSAILLFAALAGAGFAEESISAGIQTVDAKYYSVSLVRHSAGEVIFNIANDPTLYKLPDEKITALVFPQDKRDEETRQRLFDEGDYRPLAEQLRAQLTPVLPYASLPSNLGRSFLRWIASSYWLGDYARVLGLAAALQEMKPDEEGLLQGVRFFGGLAKLAQGDFQSMETLLNSPDGDAVYPPGSAARLYIDARILQQQAEYLAAIRTASRLLAAHNHDADWVPQAELLCAELYFQLNMPESARAVLADIKDFYSDPQIQKQAAAIAAQNNGEGK